MFTGIIQARGIVRSIQKQLAGARLVLDAPDLERPIHHGASICVNGACLTVTSSEESRVAFDIVPETLRCSTLGSLTASSRVNLEQSLRPDDRLDGHMVQGHVDGIARAQRVRPTGADKLWTFAAETSLMPFIIPKGSIAIDGVSLTIAGVDRDTFTVALIPTTLAETTLGSLRPGEQVNIETDIVAKTIVATLQRWRDGTGREPLTIEMLQANGW